MLLGKPSVVWLLATVEVVLKGDNLREFYRTLRVGSRAYITQRCVNSHGQYMVLAEYGGGGGRRGFIVAPEGREGRGWSNFVAELRKVVAFFVGVGVWFPGRCMVVQS